jgi:hypothetical protein
MSAVADTTGADGFARRLPGTLDDPSVSTGKRHDREPLLGPERLLLAIHALDLDPRALRAAAALVHALDLACRERIIDQRSSQSAA